MATGRGDTSDMCILPNNHDSPSTEYKVFTSATSQSISVPPASKVEAPSPYVPRPYFHLLPVPARYLLLPR